MKPSQSPAKRRLPPSTLVAVPYEQAFAEVVEMIQASRERALAAVNTALIDLYWRVGESISHRIGADGWGKGTVTALAAYIQERHPGARGFSSQNLWRMRQFFDAYHGQPELSTLLRGLPWSSNLHILGKSSRPEEREFYLRMATQQGWSVRELARQIDSALFERAVLHPPKVSAMLRELHPGAEAVFRDAYVVEFLDLPDGHGGGRPAPKPLVQSSPISGRDGPRFLLHR